MTFFFDKTWPGKRLARAEGMAPCRVALEQMICYLFCLKSHLFIVAVGTTELAEADDQLTTRLVIAPVIVK